MDAEDAAPGLSGELALVRRVLHRLIARMDEAGPDIPLDELRQIGGLVFAGAKTVAQLLGQQAGDDRDLQHWLAPALEVLADDWGLEL